MSIVNRPNNYTANTTIASSEVNDDFDILYNEFNGSISAANLASNAVTTAKITDANVTTAKLADNAVTAAKLSSDLQAGWLSLGYTPNTVVYNGQRSYTLTFNSVDLTGLVSAGNRLRTTRTVAAPTQSTSLNGSSQYWVKTSPNKLTFTDDFVCSAWIKLSAYPTTNYGVIVSRYNGTSGFELVIEAVTGNIVLLGRNGGSANFSQVKSVQGIPLNRWVHVTAQLDMSSFTVSSTTSYVMLDGIDVPATVTRGGTNPTALVQAGNLEIGSENGGTNLLSGKIAQVFVGPKITQANIRTLISQGLTASIISSNSIYSAYSFDGVATDLNTTTPNDLSVGGGSATATNADSPFGTQASGLISSTLDYGIVQSISFSTDTTMVVQVPEGCTIPTSGGVSAVSYSQQKAPYAFPSEALRWRLNTLLRATTATTSNATYGSFAGGGYALTVPIGKYTVGHRAGSFYASTTEANFSVSSTALTGLTAAQGNAISLLNMRVLSGSGTIVVPGYTAAQFNVTSQVAFVMYTVGATTAAGIDGGVAPAEIFAENAYL